MPATDTESKAALRELRATVSNQVCVTEFDVDESTAVSTRWEGVRLGAVDVFRYEGHGVQRGHRNRTHIRNNPVDDYLILMPLIAPVQLAQAGQRNSIEPGQFAFLSTREPYEVDCSGAPKRHYSELMVRIAGPTLRGQLPLLDYCSASPIDATRSAGRILHFLLESVLADAKTARASQRPMLEAMMIGGIAAAAMESPLMRSLQSQVRLDSYAIVRTKAQVYIDRQLSDPSLDATMVARTCNVSLRLLHAAFAETDQSVSGLIRQLRLTKCRDNLIDPLMIGRPILQIATQWGYSVPSSFTRAYRAQFGCSPSDDREKALRRSDLTP